MKESITFLPLTFILLISLRYRKNPRKFVECFEWLLVLFCLSDKFSHGQLEQTLPQADTIFSFETPIQLWAEDYLLDLSNRFVTILILIITNSFFPLEEAFSINNYYYQ
jgi:hypothetical protein